MKKITRVAAALLAALISGGVWLAPPYAQAADADKEILRQQEENRKMLKEAEKQLREDAKKAQKEREAEAKQAAKAKAKADKEAAKQNQTGQTMTEEEKRKRAAEYSRTDIFRPTEVRTEADKKALKAAEKAEREAKKRAEKLANTNQPTKSLLAKDLTYKGLKLGDDEAAMKKALGEPLSDTDKNVFDVRVRYHQFKKEVFVGVLVRTGQVVDIVIKDRDYKGRAGITYGATPHYIFQTFGETPRRVIGGVNCYVYSLPDNPGHHLVLEAEPDHGSLRSWRMTSLPVTEEEADLRFDEFEPISYITGGEDALQPRPAVGALDTSAVDLTPAPVRIKVADPAA